MPYRLLKLDWQMLTLNAASGAALISESVLNNSASWAVGFLIVTVGVLNLAKAYATIKEAKRKKKDNE
jgi:hypothetical protein